MWPTKLLQKIEISMDCARKTCLTRNPQAFIYCFKTKLDNGKNSKMTYNILISLFGVLHHFQHSTGYIMTGSFMGRGNQYIQLVKVLYCKLTTIGQQLPDFPYNARGLNQRHQRWEVSVLPLRLHAPDIQYKTDQDDYKISLTLFIFKSEISFIM